MRRVDHTKLQSLEQAIILKSTACVNACMYVCIHATPPGHFVSRAPSFQGFIYDPTVGSSTTHGRVIYDPTVGSSTTPRSGHLRPHGRVFYDPTVGSSTTPRSGHLRPHGRVIYDPTVGSSKFYFLLSYSVRRMDILLVI